MNIAQHLLSKADPGTVAVIDGGSTFNYGELKSAIMWLASEVESSGTRPGDRIGIVARNSFFWVAAYLATLYSGRVAVPFPTTTRPDQVRELAAWVDARCFLVDRRSARVLAPVIGATHVIDDRSLAGHLDGGSSAWAPTVVDPEVDAVLQLTSGTTSAPKAVRVTHRNIQANTDSIIEYLALEPDDRMLVILPFPYCFGASLLHTHLKVGASVALCHTLTFPESVLDAIDTHACTGFAGVPSTYQLLMRASSITSRRLASLRHLQQAGGKLSPELIDGLVAAQPHARLFVMYGQTEATARLSYLPPEEIGRRRGSIGRGVPGVALSVLDADDQEVSPGEVGEVVASGPSITKGYLNDPEATADKYRGGMLRTGDLATVDDDGYVYIVDRLSDFIKSWGFRVSSQEIEDAAMRIPGVVAAAAVGVPDEAAGEAIVLFVVRDSAKPIEMDVLAWLRRSLAKHMVPRSVRFLTELPLNANGKIIKAKLREIALSQEVVDRTGS